MLQNIKEKAYQKYILDWMKNHNHTIFELMRELDDYFIDCEDEMTIEDKLIYWIKETDGFRGEIWVCRDEFLDNEYEDEDYMKYLLDEDEFALYLKDMEE